MAVYVDAACNNHDRNFLCDGVSHMVVFFLDDVYLSCQDSLECVIDDSNMA